MPVRRIAVRRVAENLEEAGTCPRAFVRRRDVQDEGLQQVVGDKTFDSLDDTDIVELDRVVVYMLITDANEKLAQLRARLCLPDLGSPRRRALKCCLSDVLRPTRHGPGELSATFRRTNKNSALPK